MQRRSTSIIDVLQKHVSLLIEKENWQNMKVISNKLKSCATPTKYLHSNPKFKHLPKSPIALVFAINAGFIES